MYVPFNCGEIRQFPRLDLFIPTANMTDDVLFLRQQMNRSIVLAAIFRQTLKGRQTVKRHVDFQRRPMALKVVKLSIEIDGELLRADKRAHAIRIGVADNDFRINLAAVLQDNSGNMAAERRDMFNPSVR